jgi:pSer/pThr/pTyr-binding forkhead associated (FHA) protein
VIGTGIARVIRRSPIAVFLNRLSFAETVMKVAFMPLESQGGKQSVVITEFPVILARSSRTNLAPEAFTVSPCHCEIDAVDGVLVVRDLGSRHGTFVNESRVMEACLLPGSKLTVGLNSFFVNYSLPRRGAWPDPRGDARNSSPAPPKDNPAPGVDIGNVVALNRRRAP